MESLPENSILIVTISYYSYHNGQDEIRNYAFKSYESASKFLLEEELKVARSLWFAVYKKGKYSQDEEDRYEDGGYDEDDGDYIPILTKEMLTDELLSVFEDICYSRSQGIYRIFDYDEHKEVYTIHLTKVKIE